MRRSAERSLVPHDASPTTPAATAADTNDRQHPDQRRPTKGNLSADESAELTEVLAQLRSRFVQVAKLVAAQMQREMQGMPGPGGGGDIAGSIGMGGMSAGMSVGGTTSPGGLIMPD
jgi:hypothetical protein